MVEDAGFALTHPQNQALYLILPKRSRLRLFSLASLLRDRLLGGVAIVARITNLRLRTSLLFCDRTVINLAANAVFQELILKFFGSCRKAEFLNSRTLLAFTVSPALSVHPTVQLRIFCVVLYVLADALLAEGVGVLVDGKGFDGEPPQADAYHLDHQLIEDVHVFLFRTTMHQPPRLLTNHRYLRVTR